MMSWTTRLRCIGPVCCHCQQEVPRSLVFHICHGLRRLVAREDQFTLDDWGERVGYDVDAVIQAHQAHESLTDRNHAQNADKPDSLTNA